jgi:hypothetical protein
MTLNPKPPAEVFGDVTLFVPFDVGCAFKLTNVDASVVLTLAELREHFPEMEPPLKLLSFTLAPTFQRISNWFDASSARCLFTAEGIALLTIRGKLTVPWHEMVDKFDEWEGGPTGPRKAQAYTAVAEIVAEATRLFSEWSSEKGLTPKIKRRNRPEEERRPPHRDEAQPNRPEVRWIIPLFISYPPAALPVVSFRKTKISVAWRGVQVLAGVQEAPLEERDRIAIEAVMSANCLAWESLHVLDRLLGDFLQNIVLKPPAASQRDEDLFEGRHIRFFSRYLLDATRPLRWTIRGELLSLLDHIDSQWKVEDLRGAAEAKTELVALYNEQEEARRQKTRGEQLETTFKIITIALVSFPAYSAFADAVHLLNSEEVKDIWLCRFCWGVILPIIAIVFLSVIFASFLRIKPTDKE